MLAVVLVKCVGPEVLVVGSEEEEEENVYV